MIMQHLWYMYYVTVQKYCGKTTKILRKNYEKVMTCPVIYAIIYELL